MMMTTQINRWQARELANFLAAHDDGRDPEDDTLATAYATLVRLDEDGEPDPNGYVLGVLTDDGEWRAFWGDGGDVSDEYQLPSGSTPAHDEGERAPDHFYRGGPPNPSGVDEEKDRHASVFDVGSSEWQNEMAKKIQQAEDEGHLYDPETPE